MKSDDDLSSALGALPVADLEPRTAARIRARAHVVLEGERRYQSRPLLGRAARVYSRAVEPVLVTGACAAYLYWAVSTAFALVR
jgi:hypothetical protein